MIGITKKALKQVGIKQTTFTDMHHLITKVETLVNMRALGGYSSIIGDMILRPMDLIFPVSSPLKVEFTQKLPQTDSPQADYMKQAKELFQVFRELWSSLYIHDLRKTSTRRHGRHMLDVGDYVIILDRVRTKNVNSFGIIMKKISDHHLQVKVISRGAGLDKNFQIVKPAKTIIIDRAPESLVLVSKQGKFFDPFDIIPEKKQPIREKWILTG